MKTKTCLFIALLICSSINIFSQYIITASHNKNDYYSNLLNDSISIPTCTCYNEPKYDSIKVDLNNDGTYDLKLTVFGHYGNQWYSYSEIIITPLHGNQIAIAGFDSCYNKKILCELDHKIPMVKNFSINDTIYKKNFWIDSMAYLYIYDWDNLSLSPKFIGNYFSTKSIYLGMKVLTSIDTFYGWLNIDHSIDSHLTIKLLEYACNSNSTSINKFQKINSLKIFPNPNNGKFIISNDWDRQTKFDLIIYNLLGEAIYSTKMISSGIEIDMHDQAKGFYLIKTNANKQYLINKIIIE